MRSKYGTHRSDQLNDLKNVVDTMCAVRGISRSKLSRLISEKHPEYATSSSNLSNKIYKGTMRYTEIALIADVLDFDIRFIPKEEATGEASVRLNATGKIDDLEKRMLAVEKTLRDIHNSFSLFEAGEQ